MTLNMLKISIEFRFYIIFHFIHVKNVEKHYGQEYENTYEK